MKLQQLPYSGTKKTIVQDHSTNDIVKEVLKAHQVFAKDYDLVADKFWKGNQLDTINYIFNYCKRNFPYKVETEEMQTTRSPGAILNTAKSMGVDCKHYAGWIAGILDALNRQGKNFSWKYRFASYDLFSHVPEHVFIVVTIAGVQYWVDPVLQTFNQRYPTYFYSFDKKPNMAIQRIGAARVLDSSTIATINSRPAIVPTTIVDTSLIKTIDITPITKQQVTTAAENSSLKKYLPLLLIGGAVLYFATRKRRRK